MICPVCQDQGKKSQVKFIGHRIADMPWDYDEQGHVIERAINVRIECSEGHQTDARLKGILDKAEQI
jgi:hypothetical protein